MKLEQVGVTAESQESTNVVCGVCDACHGHNATAAHYVVAPCLFSPLPRRSLSLFVETATALTSHCQDQQFAAQIGYFIATNTPRRLRHLPREFVVES